MVKHGSARRAETSSAPSFGPRSFSPIVNGGGDDDDDGDRARGNGSNRRPKKTHAARFTAARHAPRLHARLIYSGREEEGTLGGYEGVCYLSLEKFSFFSYFLLKKKGGRECPKRGNGAIVSHDCFRRKFINYDVYIQTVVYKRSIGVESVHNCVIYAVMRI